MRLEVDVQLRDIACLQCDMLELTTEALSMSHIVNNVERLENSGGLVLERAALLECYKNTMAAG